MLILDTHILLGIIFEQIPVGIGSTTRADLETAWLQGEAAVSAISFWEIEMLVDKNKLELECPTDDLRRNVLQDGLKEIAVNGIIGIRAASLEDFHRDPADRIIVATALQGHTLLTRDAQILAWSDPLERQDARK